MHTSPSLLYRLDTLSRQESTIDTATAMYLLMLKILSHSNVLTPKRKLFYPAIGADLFPLYYVNESWFSDKRLSLQQIQDAFGRLTESDLCQKLKNLLPRNRNLADRLHYQQEDFAACCDRPSWIQAIQPGDVVFLKHAREYILGQMDRITPSNWLESIIQQIPSMAMVVIFEPMVEKGSSFPQLSEFLLGSGYFEDQMPVIFKGTSMSLIDKINDRILSFDRRKIRTKIHCPGCNLPCCCHCRNGRNTPEVYFEGIGALRVITRK